MQHRGVSAFSFATALCAFEKEKEQIAGSRWLPRDEPLSYVTS